jgi:hypothetical protein
MAGDVHTIPAARHGCFNEIRITCPADLPDPVA